MRREEIKQFLLELAAHTPPEDQTGAHLSDVLQVPDLMHMIMRDFECRRHNLRPGETPNLKVLAMRYGVTEDAIRRCNNLEDRSLPIARSFLYIPNAATSSAKDFSALGGRAWAARIRHVIWYARTPHPIASPCHRYQELPLRNGSISAV